MNTRRRFLATITCGLVALVVVAGSALADELIGAITKVNADSKTLTVLPDGDDKKEIDVKVTDETEVVSKKGNTKVDFEKLSKRIDGAKEKGAKGVQAKITHEKGTASKIQYIFQKKAAEKAISN